MGWADGAISVLLAEDRAVSLWRGLWDGDPVAWVILVVIVLMSAGYIIMDWLEEPASSADPLRDDAEHSGQGLDLKEA